MTHAPLPGIAPQVHRLLERHARDYLPLRQIVASLPARVRRELGLTQRLTTAEVLKKLVPHLGETLQVYQRGPAVYLGVKMSLAELLVRRLQRSPGLSPKQLGMGLPMSKRDYIATLNTLLEAGRLVCAFGDQYTPRLKCAAAASSGRPEPEPAEDDRQTFYTAYQRIGQGRSFVRIHRLREALPWSRQRFDRLLLALLAEYSIELHGGDPSLLTAEDIRQSYTSADGTLYIALSWRGNI